MSDSIRQTLFRQEREGDIKVNYKIGDGAFLVGSFDELFHFTPEAHSLPAEEVKVLEQDLRYALEKGTIVLE